MSTGDPEQENRLTSGINQEIDKTKIPLQSNNEIDDQDVSTGEEKLLKEKETVVIFCSDSSKSLKTSENFNVVKEESESQAEHLNNPEERLKDKPLKQAEHREIHDAEKFDLDNKPFHDASVKDAAGSGNVSESIMNCSVQPEGITDVVQQDIKMQKGAETIPVDLHMSKAETVACEESEIVEQSHSHGTSNETMEVKAGKDDPEAIEKKQGSEGDSRVDLKEPSGTVGEITQQENEETATSTTIWYTDGDSSTRPLSESEEMSPGKASEDVSYSTTVVGGVVHRVPINSSSPKAQQRNSSSPQSTTGKKKSIIETLFGHRTKSKGAESHTVVADGKDEEYVNVDGQDHETENGTAKKETDTTHKREDEPTHPAETDKSTLINPAQQLHDNNVKEEFVAVLKSDVPCEPSGAEANDVKPSVSEDGQNLEEKTLEVKQSKDSTVETVCINQESDVRIEERVGQEITSKEAEVIKPIAEQDNEVVEMNAVESKPMVQELSVDGTSEETAVQEAKDTAKPAAEKALSSDSNQDEEDAELEGRVIKREANPSQSPKTRRMQMRFSYAEDGSGRGGKEVEVIGTPEGIPESAATQKGKTPPDHRVPCRALGDADHEGWLAKKGGTLFFSTWKRKWVVLKEGKLYYYKTSFDQEASGIISMLDASVAAAPETKKNFCFKCVQSAGPKPQVTLFMADSQDDMDKWLSVLSAACRGEDIQKTSQQQQQQQQKHLPVKDDVGVQKRKSASNPKQRTSSVLAVGGRHDFLEEEENGFANRRRSSHESPPHAANSGLSSPEKGVLGEETLEPVESRRAYQAADDDQESDGLASSEKPAIVEGEVLANSEAIIELSCVVKQSTSDGEMPAVDSTDSPKPVELTGGGDEETAMKTNAFVVESAATEAASCVTQKDPRRLDVEQSAGLTMDEPVMEADSSIGGVETEQHASANLSDNMNTETLAVETDSTLRQESSGTDHATLKVTPTPSNSVQESKQPPQKLPSERVSGISLSSEPASPSNTKWYFMLDEEEGWSVPNQQEDSRQPLPSTCSDSTTDGDSVKSLPRQSALEDDDQLLAMVRSIREARLSIVGLPLWEGADRVRALSSVGEKEGKIVRLKTLERTLKDKERTLSRLEELLAHDPEVNKHSLGEWTARHSDLCDELVFFEGKEVEPKKEESNQGENKEKKEYQDVIENSETIDIRIVEKETTREEMTEKRGRGQEEEDNVFASTVVNDNKEGEQSVPVGEEEGKNDKQPVHQEGEEERTEQAQGKETNQEQQNKTSKDSEDGERTHSPGESSTEITLDTEAVVTVQEIAAEHRKKQIDDRSSLDEHGQTSEKEENTRL